MRRTLGLIASLLLLLTTACTAQPPEPPPSPVEPHVTLSVPETVISRSKAQLVLDSAGHEGQTVQLYVFREDFDQDSKCSDATVQPIPLQLLGGPQQVTIDTGQPGDLYLVLVGENLETKCGDMKTRALINTMAEIGPACTGEGSNYSCPTVWPQYKAGDKIRYRVAAAVPSAGTVSVHVRWVGPFASVPEAKALPCPDAPVVAEDKVVLALDPKSTGATANGDPSASQLVETTVAAPGVYRLLFAAEETAYTAPYVADCEGAPLVTVH